MTKQLSTKEVIRPSDGYDPRIRPWYKDALKNGSGVTKPYIDKATKQLTITIYSTVKKDNKIIGVIGADLFINTITRAMNLKINDDVIIFIKASELSIVGVIND